MSKLFRLALKLGLIAGIITMAKRIYDTYGPRRDDQGSSPWNEAFTYASDNASPEPAPSKGSSISDKPVSASAPEAPATKKAAPKKASSAKKKAPSKKPPGKNGDSA